MTSLELSRNAELLFNYGKLGNQIQAADAIITLGNMDVRIAEKAVQLWQDGIAPIIVTTGARGRLTPKNWVKSEAAVFADVLFANEIPRSNVIIEDESTNVPENIAFAIHSLEQKGLLAKSLILVTLPFAERRILAQCKKQFSDFNIQITSPDILYNGFANDVIRKDQMINLIVGEIQRFEKYPEKGFSNTEVIPLDILESCRLLIGEGFSKYSIS